MKKEHWPIAKEKQEYVLICDICNKKSDEKYKAVDAAIFLLGQGKTKWSIASVTGPGIENPNGSKRNYAIICPKC